MRQIYKIIFNQGKLVSCGFILALVCLILSCIFSISKNIFLADFYAIIFYIVFFSAFSIKIFNLERFFNFNIDYAKSRKPGFKINIKIISITILFFGVFYYGLVNTYDPGRFFEMQGKIEIKSSPQLVDINLIKDDYLLKLKYANNNQGIKEVFLNDKPVILKKSKKSSETTSEYYLIPVSVVLNGKNYLKVSFQSDFPDNVDIWIKNYVSKELEDNVYILSKNSSLVENRQGPVLSMAVFMLVLLFIWLAFSYLWQNFFSVNNSRSDLINMVSFSVPLIPLGTLWLISKFDFLPLPIYFLVSSPFLYTFTIISIIFIEITFILIVTYKQ